MKTVMLACLMTIASVAMAQTAPTFHAPSDSQVWQSDWNCTKDPAAQFDEQAQNADGTYSGIGYFADFRCVLVVGKSVQYRAGCAYVTWDANGNVISVENFAQGLNRTGFAVPCTP